MAAGIEARGRGKKVLLVEHKMLGGTCLNIGCVPSKNLLAAAGQRHRALTKRAFPMVPTSSGGVDLPALMTQKQDLIDSMRQAKYADVADAHGFPIRYGHARFVDPQTLAVDGERLVAPAYVVATGVAPHVPDLPGLDAVDWLTSTTAMEQVAPPASMVVIGGGYVGLEQAQLWAHLGVEVTLVGRFASHAEPEIADVLRGVFADDGIAVTEQRATSVHRTDGGVTVRTADGTGVTGERLLVATGRFAYTGDLGLDAAGVKTDERGFVVVDANQRTSNPKVFAAGDVSGAPQYVYVAAQTGHVAAAGALGDPSTVDYRGLPAVTFTTPQIASAGLTEEQAIQAGYGCDCRVLGAQDIPRALVNRDTRGALKLVIDAETGKVLGVHAALDDQVRAYRRRPRRHLGAVPDDERGAADRGRAVPLRHANELLRMTGRDTSGPRTRTRTGAGWAWLLALPILCCAGPGVLAAVSAGSLTAALGGVAGSLVLLAAGAAVLVVAVVVLVLRRRVRR